MPTKNEKQTTETQAIETQETGLVVAEENAVAINVPNLFAGMDLAELGFSEEDLRELTGLDNIGTGEVRIPYAQLISKQTATNKPGDIVFPDGTVIHGADGEVAEGICVLKVQPVRVYFPTPFKPTNTYICRSIDARVGHTDGKYAGQACDGCEFAKYPEAGGASPCRDQRLLLCTRPDGSLFHIQTGGVGVRVWKDFMSAQIFHLLPKAKNILGAFELKMGVKIIDTDYGPFPALDFRVDPKKPFVDSNRLVMNLNALKAYKEFEKEHLETAANQTKVSMAMGDEATAGDGENKGLF